MKILIIGSGISGLSTYQFLQKHLAGSTPPHTIKIYEAYPESSHTIGGALGLASNGMRVLNTLNPAIVEKLLSPTASFNNEFFTLRNSYGKTLSRVAMSRKERYGLPLVMTARDTIYSALEDELPEGAVQYGKRVASIKERDGGEVEVEFEDGTLELADLVLGADGVRSAVRSAVVGIGFEAEYRGLTGIGGFTPLAPFPQQFKDSLAKDPIVMTFGRDGFFAYSPCCSLKEENPRLMWWSTFSSATPPSRDLPIGQIREQLLNRHQDWVSPSGDHVHKEFIKLVTNGDSEVLVLPVYITPPLPRFSSASGRVILLGDAAHAMPPDSGQGASLALEDSQTIALLLAHYLDGKKGVVEEGEALKKAAEGYETLRRGRISKVLKEAMARGDRKKTLSWWEEWLRDWFIWLGRWIPEKWQDWEFGYTVSEEVERFLAGGST